MTLEEMKKKLYDCAAEIESVARAYELRPALEQEFIPHDVLVYDLRAARNSLLRTSRRLGVVAAKTQEEEIEKLREELRRQKDEKKARENT